jgi:hypothetical protein
LYLLSAHIRSTNERFQGIHEPLISKSQFEDVQDVLLGRTKNTGLKHDYRYRKTLLCTYCSYSLIAERQKGIVYYRCHTPACPKTCLREDHLDTQIQNEVLKVTVPPREVSVLESEFDFLEQEKLVEIHNLKASLELRIANLVERLDRLADAYIERSLDKETLDAKNRQLLLEKAALQEALNEIIQDNPYRYRKEKFLELLKRLELSTREANFAEQRDALKEATSNLRVDQKNLVVTWKKPFEVIVDRSKFDYCEPSRDTPRTGGLKPSSFSRKLWKLIQGEEADSDGSIHLSHLNR